MPRRSLLLALALSLGAMLALRAGTAPSSLAQPATVALQDAILDGLIDVEFVGTGSASGAAVRMRVTRRTADDLIVTVPTGIRLLNADVTEQDMVVRGLLGESTGGSRYTPLTEIELRDDQQRTYVLEAYCLEAHLDNPSSGTLFTYDGFVDAGLIGVLNAIDSVRVAQGELLAIQAAVWVLTDDISADELDDIGYGLSSRQIEIVRELLQVAGYDPAAFRLFR